MVDRVLKDIFEKGIFRGELRFDEPLSAHTSLRIGGPVDIMVIPEDPVSLKNVVRTSMKEGIPFFVLGEGSNILVRDEGIDGVVISLKAFRNIRSTREANDESVTLFVDAGVSLGTLLNLAGKEGYTGIEPLAGIPGCFGGAIRMNAGSFGTEIKDIISSIAVMDRNGEIRILKRDELKFSYRSLDLPDDLIILSGNITLRRDKPEAVRERIKEFYLKKKLTQPLGRPSAGCVFKNPAEDTTAGRLIDDAGCKGMRVGDVEVSTVHANYFLNTGRATCRDFLMLMDQVRERVRKHSGIILEPEIRIIGRVWDDSGSVS